MKRKSSRIAPQGASRILLLPFIIAAASLAGLIIGLTGEGWRDILSVLLLILPLAVIIRAWLRRG